MNKNIIILSFDDKKECWGSIAEICRVKGWSYNYLKRLKFPFTYRGINFEKVKFRDND